MAKVISFANQKGGVGKTTLTMNIGSQLTKKGYKVLFVDLDPQGNLSQYLNTNTDGINTVSEVLLEECKIEEAIYPTQYGDIVPADIVLSGVDMVLSTKIARESILKRALSTVKSEYDYILIDCSPALNIFTFNAFMASDSISIVTNAEFFSTVGIKQLLRSITQVKSALNPSLEINGIIYNKNKANTKYRKHCRKELEETIGVDLYVYEAGISDAVDISATSLAKQSVLDFTKKEKIQNEFIDLCEEFVLRTEGTKEEAPFEERCL